MSDCDISRPCMAVFLGKRGQELETGQKRFVRKVVEWPDHLTCRQPKLVIDGLMALACPNHCHTGDLPIRSQATICKFKATSTTFQDVIMICI